MKDMNGQTILLISDMRQVYLAEILTKKGMSVRCLDIRNSQTVEEQLLKLKKFLAGAAMLVLPIPVTKVPEQERLNEILNKNLANDTLVLGGCFTEEQRELLDRRGIRYLDFIRTVVGKFCDRTLCRCHRIFLCHHFILHKIKVTDTETVERQSQRNSGDWERG